jgi:ABC-type multidrug transport system ATPase subunit
MAQPPGKRLQSLTLLSGGEQALTAVALIFGLFLTNPAPICVLDEVDAPLDDANIERFCDLLDTMVGETQTRYLIVTHNAVTMSRMHRLFGVTMVGRGVSRLVSVDLGGAEELLASGLTNAAQALPTARQASASRNPAVRLERNRARALPPSSTSRLRACQARCSATGSSASRASGSGWTSQNASAQNATAAA